MRACPDIPKGFILLSGSRPQLDYTMLGGTRVDHCIAYVVCQMKGQYRLGCVAGCQLPSLQATALFGEGKFPQLKSSRETNAGRGDRQRLVLYGFKSMAFERALYVHLHVSGLSSCLLLSKKGIDDLKSDKGAGSPSGSREEAHCSNCNQQMTGPC